MARITRVAKAQQRYHTLPILGADGKPVKIALKRKNGQPRTDKRGNPVFITKTMADTSRPKPLFRCDKCGKTIEIGQPYKHMTPRSGPYGGNLMTRCQACPDWQEWEYRSSLSARLAQIANDFWETVNSAESQEDVQSALQDAQSAIEELAQEKKDGAQNIEEGFGHSTYVSEELQQQGEDLESWAQEIGYLDVPNYPEAESQTCEICDGAGEVGDNPDEMVTCERCDGAGNYTPEQPTEEQLEEWRSEVQDACAQIDDSPV
jgi:hypothetical protein